MGTDMESMAPSVSTSWLAFSRLHPVTDAPNTTETESAAVISVGHAVVAPVVEALFAMTTSGRESENA
jgi:hypothetical protein